MRIGAGRLRGRVLQNPKGSRIRPTPDRLREALFTVIGPAIDGATVADLFAGSGLVGIEALSRGARSAVFVEKHPGAAQLVRTNLARLEISAAARVIAGDALDAVGEIERADLVFLDPPAAQEDAGEQMLAALDRSSAPAPGGWVIVQHRRDRRPSRPLVRLRCVRTIESGDAALSFYRSSTADVAPAGATVASHDTPAPAAAAVARAVERVGPLALHATFVIWLTWPLASRMSTHLPETSDGSWSDPLQIAWVLAYQTHRLFTAPWAIAEANIYHPTPHALFYGEAAYGALPYFLPAFLLTGNPALALNLTFLGSIVLTAWALHFVVHRWTGSHVGGAFAGWVFLTTPWVLWVWLPVAANYAVLVYLPLLMLACATPSRRFRDALRLLPFVVLQGLTSVYMAAAVLLPLGVLGVARSLRHATRRAGAYLLGIVACAAMLLAVAYAGHLLMRADNPSLASQTFWPDAGTRLTALPWGMFSQMDPTGVPSATFVVIAAGALSAVTRALSAAERTAWRHATFWALIGILISFTPVVRWYDTTIRLPGTQLPGLGLFHQALREPFRLGIVGLLGLAILAGLALAELSGRIASLLRTPAERAIGGIVLALVPMTACYIQYSTGAGMPRSPYGGLRPLPAQYPLQAAIAPASPVLDVLRRPGGPLLELPAPVGAGELPAATQAHALYRSIFHWRPVLNGYDSYWPAAFPTRMALAARLPDPEALAALRRDTGLAAVLVHTAELAGDRRAAWIALAADGARADFQLLARDGDDLLFGVAADDAPGAPQEPSSG